ncbi:MAG: hypothetical protein ACYSWZ_18885 [Planctomycetota bacterium]|jgi:hypothetical protein
MKGRAKTLKIIAIVLNTIFLAIMLLIFILSGGHLESLRDVAGSTLIFGFPAITLITIALTFHKKIQILGSVLKVIAIILNVTFLVIFIHETARGNPEGLAMWLFGLLVYGLPVVNVVALASTFKKEKEASVG